MEIFTELIDFLSYGFIRRALIAGSLTALLCSTLGVVLVLRRLSLIGDGLAHVTFGSAAVALVLKSHPFVISLPITALCSIGILKLVKKAKVSGDAAIGIVSSVGIAIGVLFASLGGGFNVDLFSFLFGSILAVNDTEVFISTGLFAVVMFFLSRFYNEILSTTFDEDFARVTGINTELINTALAVMTSVTVVLTMKVAGIMLTSSLLILPAVTAFQRARSFKGAVITAAVISLVSVNLGIILSFILDLPTGALIVMINFVLFSLSFLYNRLCPS